MAYSHFPIGQIAWEFVPAIYVLSFCDYNWHYLYNDIILYFI